MSLIRLLAAGSSLRGIRDRRSPYKMTQQHLLPKFGSGKPADNAVTDPVSLAGPMAQKHATQMTTAEAGNTDFVMAADLEEPLAVPVAPGEAPAAIAQAAVDQ